MDTPAFDTEGLFDEDYLYFYQDFLTDEHSDAQTELIWQLLRLEPGMRVLDLACGHGRIANRLAARGCQVTGLDATPLFLDHARADAARRGVEVEYVHGDMRVLPWTGYFDRVINWFTAFGYFDDPDNREVLNQVARAVKPGGQVVFELLNRDWLIRQFQPVRLSAQQGDDLMIDRSWLDPLTDRALTERIVVRNGRVRRIPFFVRLFTFCELRDWLLAAGFDRVEGYDEKGLPFGLASGRMVVLASR